MKYSLNGFAIGSSSGFSIFSPRGIQWVNEKTGDASFLSMVMNTAATHNKWFDWKPQVFDDVFSRRVYQPLPSKEECFFMIEDFFGSFNKVNIRTKVRCVPSTNGT